MANDIFQVGMPGIAISATAAATTAVPLPLANTVGRLGTGAVQVRIVNEGPNAAFLALQRARSSITFPTSPLHQE